MTRYDFLWARRLILSNVPTDSTPTYLISLLVNFSCELGQIMTSYHMTDILGAKNVIR